MAAAVNPDLTPRQRAVLEFLQDFQAGRGYPPSLRDLQLHFGFRSVNGASCHLKALIRKGAIEHDRHTSRGRRLLPSVEGKVSVERRGGSVLIGASTSTWTLSPAEARDLARQLWDAAAEPLAG